MSYKLYLTLALVFLGQSHACSSGRLDTTFAVLAKKNKSTLEYLRKSHQDLLIEKARLLQTVSVSGAPSLSVISCKGAPPLASFEGARTRVAPALNGDLQINEWSLWLDVNPLNSSKGSSGGVMLPLFSTRRQRARLLDTMIAIEKMKAYYQIESTILQDIKGICDLVVSINQTHEELSIRSEVGLQIDSIGRFIANFSKSGQINKRSVHQLKLAFLENSLQMAHLKKRTELLEAELQNRFFIEHGQVHRVIEECRAVVLNSKRAPAAAGASRETFTIAQSIDSLNEQMLAARRSYAKMADCAVKVGPRFDVPGDWGSVSLGTGAQCSFSFISKKAPGFGDSMLTAIPVTHFFLDTVTGPDSTAFKDVRTYIEQTRYEIATIIEELKSGMYYSLPWLNDLFSRIIYSQTNIVQLQYSYLRYRINIIQSLEALGLRSDLMALYFEDK